MSSAAAPLTSGWRPDSATWSEPRHVKTKQGVRELRKTAATGAFWDAWREQRQQLKTLGISCGKDQQGNWEVCWWREVAEADTLEALSSAVDDDVALPCNPGLAYLGYQRAGIAYALKRRATLIADEMGLGKTIQALGVANATGAERILVICPASLRLNWAREARKWLVGVASTQQIDADWHAGRARQTRLTITGYERAVRAIEELRKVEWDLLIIDEAHALKNRRAKRTSALLLEPPPHKRLLLLTGTPILNRPEEAWTLLAACDRILWGSYSSFTRRYCDGHVEQFGRKTAWVAEGAVRLDELQRIARQTCMVRRTKDQVLTELPPKRRQIVELEIPEAAHLVEHQQAMAARRTARFEELSDALETAKLAADQSEYDRALAALHEATGAAFEEMSAIRHQLAVAKLPAAIDHLQACEGKVVVFAHHRDVIAQLRAALPNSVSLVGGDELEARQAAVDRFQTDPTCRYFFGSIKAAGVGLTLTAASHVVFVELDWTPGWVQQAEDRCIAQGQPILTAEGWMPVELIQVGDLVVAQHGGLEPVTDTWHRGHDGPMAEVKLTGWTEPLITTADHRYLLADGTWREAGALRPGDRIAKPAHAPAAPALQELEVPEECRVPQTFLGAEGAPQRNGRLIQMPASVAVTDEALFVFGYYLGDGFARHDGHCGSFVSLAGNTTTKRKALARCRRWLESYGLHCSEAGRADDAGVELRAYSREWAQWFALHFGRVCAEKRMPLVLMGLNQAQAAALLAGLVASDGYVRDGRVEYVTASDKLAAHVAMVVSRAGFLPLHTRNSTGQHIIAYSITPSPGYSVRSITLRAARRDASGSREQVYDLTVPDGQSFVVGLAVVHNCHRIGQHNPVLVQHLLVAGSLDVHIAQTIVEKQEMIDKALDVLPVIVPLAPRRERAATADASRATLEEEGRAIDQALRARLHAALCQLAASDQDRARFENGVGFSKYDGGIGHSLAGAEPQTWSHRQAAAAKRLCVKYRRQVGDIS